VATVSLSATVGQSALRVGDGEGGTRLLLTDRDFIFPAADLILSGSLTTPAEGDRVTETIGTKTCVFEVMPYAGEPCWRYCDPTRNLIRVRTKQISEA
jgi:hypothetical protein